MTPRPDSRADWRDAYQELRRSVRDAHLLERAYGYYACVGIACSVLLVTAVAVPFILPSSAGWNLIAIVLLSLAIVQSALLGHDAGHVAIFRHTRANWLVGELCWSLIAGIGFWYWNDRHNRHHGRTNDVTADPDLRPSLLDRILGRSGLAVTLLSLFLSAIMFRFESWGHTRAVLRGSRRVTEAILLSVNLLLWAIFCVLLGWRGVGLFVASQMLGSLYLAAIIAPNHRGMPMWAQGAELSFLERQVLSSRNLTTGPACDLFYGGLNSQIEHHLFPTMPRAHLRRARALVRPFCVACGLAYEEATPLRAYRQVIMAVAQGESFASMLE
mgnify:CR=1 FL=1